MDWEAVVVWEAYVMVTGLPSKSVIVVEVILIYFQMFIPQPGRRELFVHLFTMDHVGDYLSRSSASLSAETRGERCGL